MTTIILLCYASHANGDRHILPPQQSASHVCSVFQYSIFVFIWNLLTSRCTFGPFHYHIFLISQSKIRLHLCLHLPTCPDLHLAVTWHLLNSYHPLHNRTQISRDIPLKLNRIERHFVWHLLGEKKSFTNVIFNMVQHKGRKKFLVLHLSKPLPASGLFFRQPKQRNWEAGFYWRPGRLEQPAIDPPP